MFHWLNGTIAAVGQMQQASMIAAARSMELALKTYARLWGQTVEEVLPADKRFQDEAWSENAGADFIKQAYLITTRWMEDVVDGMAKLDPDMHHRMRFWTQQLADALSPANFALTNPAVMQEIVRTGGSSLIRGMSNLLEDMGAGRVSQVPADSFTVGVDLATTPGSVIYRNPLIEIIQYSPSTKKVYEIPMLMIPPWINKYYVMDLSPGNSMYRHLVGAGFSVFTISWKNPDHTILDLSWDDYMDQGILQAIRVVREIAGAQRVNCVGYCLGGIIQQVTLAYLAAKSEDPINSATYFATHQDFSNAGDVTVFISEAGVRLLEWMMQASGGYLDGRSMAATFNMLRANDLLWNYVVHNYLLGRQPPAFDLLYWNSDNTRVPGKVHSFLVREFFLENKLIQPNGIHVKDVDVDLGRIQVPTYTVAALGDHIVPWQGTFKMRELLGGPVRFILTSGGHIAGIINPPEESRREYWINASETTDAEQWLETAEHIQGSWWPDWIAWLQERSGPKVAPPPLGSQNYPQLADAPGIYVLER